MGAQTAYRLQRNHGMSKFSKINNSMETKKDLYYMFSNGILLLKDGKLLFSLRRNGERNEMISSRMFSYKTRTYRWQSIQESRFQKIAQMFDILKLKIRIKVTTRFLSPGVNYGAYLIFKFCDTKDFTRSIPKYVNLKYKKGGDNLHAYFATWKDNKWMMIELCRFLTHKKDTNFEVLLESFSRYYCGNTPIYVEGIEFRVIDNVKNEEIKEVQQILTSNLNKDQLSSLNEVTRKTHLMLPAREVVYHSSNMKHFHLQPSAESRFQEVIELLQQQVFPYHLQKSKSNAVAKYRIFLLLRFQAIRKMSWAALSSDLLHRNKKEDRIIYFRSPNPWNLHENNSVPEEREDGWMDGG